MIKKGLNRATPGARKNQFININLDKDWFTRRLMRGFYKVDSEIQSLARGIAKEDGVSLPEIVRRFSDEGATAMFRLQGCLRKAQREAERLGISIGHLLHGMAWPDRSLN